MVSKSYVVNECSRVIDDEDKLTRMSKIDRYILQISNEMVSRKNGDAKTNAREKNN